MLIVVEAEEAHSSLKMELGNDNRLVSWVGAGCPCRRSVFFLLFHAPIAPLVRVDEVMRLLWRERAGHLLQVVPHSFRRKHKDLTLRVHDTHTS